MQISSKLSWKTCVYIQSKSFCNYRHDFASKIVQKIFFLVYSKINKDHLQELKKAEENQFLQYFTGVGPKRAF